MTTSLERNLAFWHWYPELLLEGLTPEQCRWQPEHHDTTINFAIWHAYRAEDELLHGLLMQRPSVHASEDWAHRLPVGSVGVTPFGNGATREQIAGLDFETKHLVAYARAVGESVSAYLASLGDEQAAEMVALPFFAAAYPGYDRLSRAETVAFFSIGHVSEHLGEVQMLKGMLGLKGAPL